MTINLYWRTNSGVKELIKSNLRDMNEAAKERDILIKSKDAKKGSALILRENMPTDIAPATIIERPAGLNLAPEKPKEEKPIKIKKSKKQRKAEKAVEVETIDEPIEPTADTIPESDESDDSAEKEENND